MSKKIIKIDIIIMIIIILFPFIFFINWNNFLLVEINPIQYKYYLFASFIFSITKSIFGLIVILYKKINNIKPQHFQMDIFLIISFVLILLHLYFTVKFNINYIYSIIIFLLGILMIFGLLMWILNWTIYEKNVNNINLLLISIITIISMIIIFFLLFMGIYAIYNG